MIQIQWWCPMMIQIERWSKCTDDVPWWSRSRDDPDPTTWRWIWLNDDPDDTTKKTCADILCRENTFLVKRECWCICNFWMRSLVYFMYCTQMFLSKSICNVIESCHTPMFISGSFYNVKKSCQVIVGNPPIGQGLKSPELWGLRVIILS